MPKYAEGGGAVNCIIEDNGGRITDFRDVIVGLGGVKEWIFGHLDSFDEISCMAIVEMNEVCVRVIDLFGFTFHLKKQWLWVVI